MFWNSDFKNLLVQRNYHKNVDQILFIINARKFVSTIKKQIKQRNE